VSKRSASGMLAFIAAVVSIAPFSCTAALGYANAGGEPSSARIALARVRQARDLTVAADVIPPGSTLDLALLARSRTKRTRVVVDDGRTDASGISTRLRRAEVARLRRSGIDARLRRRMHMQAIVADGAVFLSDGGWTPADLIVRADAQAATIGQAIAGRQASLQTFATRRDEALDLALAALGPCLSPMVLQTGAFDADSPVLDALDLCARRGRRVRLLVADGSYGEPDRRAVLVRLHADGVAVRSGSSSDKMAVGAYGWASSADAVTSDPEAVDWGAAIPTLTRAVSARFERNWNAARDVDL